MSGCSTAANDHDFGPLTTTSTNRTAAASVRTLPLGPPVAGSYPPNPRLVGLPCQCSPITHPHGWGGDVALRNTGALAQVVVIRTAAVGLDIAARSSGRAAIDL